MEQQIIPFIQDHSVGLVSTCDGNISHAVPVFYHYVENENAFYFITKTQSRKFVNLDKNRNASFTIFTADSPVVFSTNCTAEFHDINEVNCSEVMTKLVQIHSTQDFYPSPIATMKDGTLKLIKLKIKKLDYKAYGEEIKEFKYSGWESDQAVTF